MDKPARNGKVDLLKFLFSIIVIIYHFDNAVKYPFEIFTRGYIGVEFFFVTSGFLFAKSLSKYTYQKETLISNSVGFMKKKFLSFFPYHFFFFAATFIYAWINYGWTFQKGFAQFFRSIPDLLMLRMSGISNLPLLGHEWYISAMLIVMFLLTPFAIKYRKAFLLYLCPILCVGLLGILYHQKHDLDFVSQWMLICPAGILRAAAELSLGCLCYVFHEKGTLNKVPKALLILAEVFLYALIIFYALGTLNSFKQFNDYTMLFLAAPAVLISFSDRSSVRFLNNRLVYFLGKLSFPIYLSQIFIRQILAPLPFPSYALHTTVYVVCVIAVSLLCILVMDNLQKLILRFHSASKA